jgi:hypothetical protein
MGDLIALILFGTMALAGLAGVLVACCGARRAWKCR